MSRRTKAERKRARLHAASDLVQLREPNGRLSRTKPAQMARRKESAAEAISVALEARKRHTGLSDDLAGLSDAGRPNAGTVHGLMTLRGLLSMDQFRAAEWYIGKHLEWRRALGLAASTGTPSPATFDEDGRAAWRKKVRELWARVERIIPPGSPVWAAVDGICVQQMDSPVFYAACRAGLDAVWLEFIA